MADTFHHFIKVSITAFPLVLLCSCLSSNRRHVESNISRGPDDPNPYNIVTQSSPKLLSFDELTGLLKEPGKNTEASQKAATLFSSPFIDNTHFKKHGIPKPKYYQNLGPSLRISTWNIEKSIKIANVATALSSEIAFKANLKLKTLKKKSSLEAALRQRAALAASDVLLSQEMDIGHCGSEYLFAAKHLAQKLGMNFVYAPQQLEIDPVYLGVNDADFKNKALSANKCGNVARNSEDYKGIFGVAVLSRYPIKRVQVFPLKNQPYDWHTGEIRNPDFLENLRRYGAKKLFKFRTTREVKIGGRGFTRVDLHVPGIPHETLTVINTHLEIKAPPKQRLVQLKEILSYMADIQNPVVMAGDFNNASRDVSATSVIRASSRTASNPNNILSTGLRLAKVNIFSRARALVNSGKNFKNPLAWHIPYVLPNKKKSLF